MQHIDRKAHINRESNGSNGRHRCGGPRASSHAGKKRLMTQLDASWLSVPVVESRYRLLLSAFSFARSRRRGQLCTRGHGTRQVSDVILEELVFRLELAGIIYRLLDPLDQSL